ncbi:response regulator [Parafilimonas sp.]|uniref:response regulator n=1 Tax=Parafilimonas sp. TaxID=1969739 RepID=UPI0039E692A5
MVRTQNDKEILNILQAENVRLIICDVMMPEMDGFAFCRTIKSNLWHSPSWLVHEFD